MAKDDNENITPKGKEKIRQIINMGQKFFSKYGIEGFTMRALAKNLKISQGNLYHYVKNKRELWFAIIGEERLKFRETMNQIAETHKGSFVVLLKKFLDAYLEFNRTDLPRFQLMHFTPIPPEVSIGPFEKRSRENDPIYVFRDIIEKAIEAKEFSSYDVNKFTTYLGAIALGESLISIYLDTKGFYSDIFENTDEFLKFTKDMNERLIKFLSEDGNQESDISLEAQIFDIIRDKEITLNKLTVELQANSQLVLSILLRWKEKGFIELTENATWKCIFDI